jgi:hypothetical protein
MVVPSTMTAPYQAGAPKLMAGPLMNTTQYSLATHTQSTAKKIEGLEACKSRQVAGQDR